MSKIYAYEDDGTRHLVRIECDESGCDAILLPGPHVPDSGWQRCGVRHPDPTLCYDWDYCPLHVPNWPADGTYRSWPPLIHTGKSWKHV